MKLTCPECKNKVDLTLYPDLALDQVVECESCGITLQITNIDSEEIGVDIVDEGK